jgi:hypothetical protein
VTSVLQLAGNAQSRVIYLCNFDFAENTANRTAKSKREIRLPRCVSCPSRFPNNNIGIRIG